MENSNGGNGKEHPGRTTREPEVPAQTTMFQKLGVEEEAAREWMEHWWGMPSYIMGDARPMFELKVKFFTWDDLLDFVRRLGLESKVTRDTRAFWWPAPEDVDRPSEWEFVDE